MQQQLYLTDSYLREFEATILNTRETEAGWEAVLDGTYFYPESGGQPSDRGTIGAANVLDVQLRDNKVIHILDAGPKEKKLPAAIDWIRRYDHMQQHTGQHLLTAALIMLYDADTIGFHLGEQVSTIDITMESISDKQIREAEEKCSHWIATAMPVTVEYVSREEFGELYLRKKALPDHVEGPIRLIRIGTVDVAHCGGTHLRSTAELQLIKIIGSEKVRETTRLHYLAGKRALDDYDAKHALLARLSNDLTCGIDDLDYVTGKLQAENKENSKQLAKIGKEMAALRAQADLPLAEEAGEHLVLVRRYDGLDPAALKSLAGRLTEAEPRLIFCGAGTFSDKGALVLAAGKNFQGDLGKTIQQLLPLFDGRGGGRGNFAQAVGDAGKLETLLKAANRLLKETG